MSFGPFPGQPGARPFTKENVVKWEIHYRFGFIQNLWWRFVPGTEFEVLWPTGWTEPEPAPGGGFIQFESADPNDHYRPELERLVGRQGWDWDWRIGKVATVTHERDTIRIKIRRKKEKLASYFLLKWA